MRLHKGAELDSLLDSLPGVVDSHCHLQSLAADEREAALDRARARGVRGFLVPATKLDEADALLAMCERHADVWCALGVHPHEAASWRDGDEARSLVAEVAQLLERHRYPTRIIAAAIRNGRQLAEAALAGAHCATAGFSVYAESFRNPYTDMGNQIFGAAWDATATDPGPEAR